MVNVNAMDEPMVPIGQVEWRQRVRVRGRVRSIRVQPWAGVASLEVRVFDETGGIAAVFTGRREIAGLTLGCDVELVGMAGGRSGVITLMNPRYRLVR